MGILDEMLKALENDESSEELMKGVNEVGDPEIDPETDAVVADGNPDSPGDDGCPRGQNDDKGEPEELPTESEANDETGNPDSPGEGTPDPEAATEGLLPSRQSVNTVKGWKPVQVFEKYLEGLKIKGVQFVSDKSKIIGDGDSDGKYTTIAGITVYAHMSGSEIDSINFVKSNGTNAGKVMSVTLAAARRSAARWLDAEAKSNKKAEKAAAKEAKKSAAEEAVSTMNIPSFLRGAFEGDDAGVADLNDVKDTSKVPDTDDAGLEKNIGLHSRNNLIEIEQEKDSYAKDGNPNSPGDDADPVSKSGEATKAPLNEFDKASNDKSGSVEEPGEDGTPVSPSGDSKEAPLNEFEKDSDAKDGNPDSPGDEGDPAATESFVAACESLMTTRKPGSFEIPEGMSLEAYVMSLGYGVLLDRALEGSMSAAERRELPDKAFGLPSQRKYPLNDESHVAHAIAFFRFCPEEDRDECAKNIIKAIRKYDMNVTCTKGNPFIKYYPKCTVVSPSRKKSA